MLFCLSMKEAEDIAPEVEEAVNDSEETSMEYTDEEATTSLAGLLKGIQLDDWRHFLIEILWKWGDNLCETEKDFVEKCRIFVG